MSAEAGQGQPNDQGQQQQQPEGGERRQFGARGGRGGRGRGRGGRGGGRGGARPEEKWTPVTNLGRLVLYGMINNINEIYYSSVPIKEHQIVDTLIKKTDAKELKEEIMKVKPVQKQTKAGQRTRFKVVVAVGDGDGHLGVGTKVATDLQNAMKGAIIAAKLNLIPVRRGYWGNKIGKPHTVPMKVTGKCGSIRMRLIPAPRGTGIVGAPPTKKLMAFTGVLDCFTQSRGNTDTMENFLRAVFDALYKTFKYLTPDLWRNRPADKEIYTKHEANYKEAKLNNKEQELQY
jgi:small subunit ribosomal protein S2e